jgi:hypothetical protein
MGTHRVQMKAVFPWLVHWACRAGTRYFLLHWLLKSAHYKIFFFNSFVPIAHQAEQTVVLGRLSLSMYL